MRFKTSSTVKVFAGITGACALFGGIAQISQDLGSSRLELTREKALTNVAQEVTAQTCRRSDGEPFQINQVIPENNGQSPTGCYVNATGASGQQEYAFVARKGGKLTVRRVFSTRQVQNRISEIKNKGRRDG